MKHGLKVDTPEDRRYFEAITKLLKCLNYLYTEGHTCGKDDEDIYDDIQDFVKYKKKYNDNLEIAVRKIKVLIYNAFGELI